MSCSIELNRQKERLEQFLCETRACRLTLTKSSFPHRRSAGSRCEVEVLKKQVLEMEATYCHPEALSWLRQTVNVMEMNQLTPGFELIK